MPLLPVTAFLLATAHDRTRTALHENRDSLAQACQGSFVGLSVLAGSIALIIGIYCAAMPLPEKDRCRGTMADLGDFCSRTWPPECGDGVRRECRQLLFVVP